MAQGPSKVAAARGGVAGWGFGGRLHGIHCIFGMVVGASRFGDIVNKRASPSMFVMQISYVIKLHKVQITC